MAAQVDKQPGGGGVLYVVATSRRAP